MDILWVVSRDASIAAGREVAGWLLVKKVIAGWYRIENDDDDLSWKKAMMGIRPHLHQLACSRRHVHFHRRNHHRRKDDIEEVRLHRLRQSVFSLSNNLDQRLQAHIPVV